jgi:hypothetical protein
MSAKADIKWHSLSGAEVLIAVIEDDVKGCYYPAGNAPKFAFSEMGDDTADVKDWTRAGAPLLGKILKSRIPVFSVTLQEARARLLNLPFMGELTEYVQAATAVTDEALGDVHVGGIYQLAKIDIDDSPALTLSDNATPTPNTFTLDTHFTLNRALGQIEILALPSGVVDGTPIFADYTPNAIVAGSGVPEIAGGVAQAVTCSILVTGFPSRGPQMQIYIPRAEVQMDGEIAFINEDPATYGLKINVLANDELAGGALFRYRQLAAPAAD